MSGDKGKFYFKTSRKVMAADNVVKAAIRDVLKGKGGSVNRLLEVGFYDPVANESLRFIVYAIRALHKRGEAITTPSIIRRLSDYTTKNMAKAAKEELIKII